MDSALFRFLIFCQDFTSEIFNEADIILFMIVSYKTSGPGNESEDLDKGVASLAQFVAECDVLDARRVDLLSSERLLDLPISTYPELKEMRAELQKLKPIYELYMEQKVRHNFHLVEKLSRKSQRGNSTCRIRVLLFRGKVILCVFHIW